MLRDISKPPAQSREIRQTQNNFLSLTEKILLSSLHKLYIQHLICITISASHLIYITPKQLPNPKTTS